MKEELTVAVYVDSQHLWFAARSFAHGQGYFNGRLDYEALLGTILNNVRRRNPDKVIRFVRQRIYVTTQSRALGFISALENFGYQVREHILRSREDSFDWDAQIVVDMFSDNPDRCNCNRCDGSGLERGAWDGSPPACNRCGDTADVVVLVSGDADFVPLSQAFPDMLTFGFPNSTSPKLPNVTYLDKSVIYE